MMAKKRPYPTYFFIKLRSFSSRVALVFCLFLAIASTAPPISPVAAGASSQPESKQDLRGIWVKAQSFRTKDLADAAIEKVEAGGFNAIFAGIFYEGRTLYPSNLTESHSMVEPGFDPLGYMVEKAHERNIQVHAWFSVGKIGEDPEESNILARRPYWGLRTPDGETIPWLNFSRPDVRFFIANLMEEVVEKYPVDGVHLDYIRYPGPEYGSDAYSIGGSIRQYRLDLDDLTYSDLPAYGVFRGNPLATPATAQVLAQFDNGVPAVTLNAYGEGEVILLNWIANDRTVAASSEILKRSLRYFQPNHQDVYLLHSKTNAERYEYDGYESVDQWLEHLGFNPIQTEEGDTKDMERDTPLVIPNVYILTPQVARDIARFVADGGNAIFIDGPVKAIQIKEIQDLIGMQELGKFFRSEMVIRTTESHPVIPASQRSSDLSQFQDLNALWKRLRRRGVNQTIELIYRRVKAERADVIVSATVSGDQENAFENHLQDWKSWLEGEYLDLLIPRAYVERTTQLENVLARWKPETDQYDQIVFGIITYIEGGSNEIKPVENLLAEMDLLKQSNFTDVMLFDLSKTSTQQIEALAAGPFAKSTTLLGE